MALPTFPFTETKSMTHWTNYTGTIPARQIPLYCTPDVLGDTGGTSPRKLARHGRALKAIVAHCFDSPDATLRTFGARLSLSTIVRPGNVALDPANLNEIRRVRPEWLTPAYRSDRGARGFVPVFAQGGTHISRINRVLGESGLALQTSGAGDGHRVAGCIATGTHGSAIGIGAVHDTVLGVHLITGPNESLFVQPSNAACTADLANWLQTETEIPTQAVNDDELFAAAQVSLGSLGIVHGVILEATPLYALRGLRLALPFADARVWSTLSDLQTTRLHEGEAARPYHFEVVFSPYPTTVRPGAFVTMFWKETAAVPDAPLPPSPDTSSDTMGLISKITDLVDISASTLALRLVMSDQLERRYKAGRIAPQVPGMVFGPTTLPPGSGTSTEVVVAQNHAHKALELLYNVLRSHGDRGEHLLGPVCVRFVPRTRALLGMNVADMNCYIELPSVRNDEVHKIYRSYWDRLDQESIAFTCHWGQVHGLTPARVDRYFGDRARRWKEARARILTTDTARRVFASPTLAEAGL